MYQRSLSLGLCVVFIAAAGVETQNAGAGIDYAMYSKIRDEGLHHSQALDHVSWLADVTVRGCRGHQRCARRPTGWPRS